MYLMVILVRKDLNLLELALNFSLALKNLLEENKIANLPGV